MRRLHINSCNKIVLNNNSKTLLNILEYDFLFLKQ
jgi:hypothetical protein